ncbi:MAG: hypothetical protein HUU15_14595 [Candidatus Brocadiae bacterium]|nr:hypothetical protein [Candidatus Brocadiia bacterium]
MINKRMEHNRGFVLLVALGVLGVLGLLAATFATLSRVERVVSNSYVDKVRAKMLAQSGIERAIASIRGRAMVQSWDDQRNDWYYREMLNAEGGTTIVYPAAVKSDIWKYTPTRGYGMPPRSLELAFEDGMTGGVNGISFPQPQSPTVNEAFSGEFPGTYMARGDVYALKVLDCASMINVNDGGEQAKRMLNNLGDILKNVDGTAFNSGGFKLGDKIQARAIARGKAFNNKSEILDEVFISDPLFAGNPTEAKKRFDAVKNFVTCHGWIDGTTTRFVNTWTGATDYVGGSYASATASLDSGDGRTLASLPATDEPVETGAAAKPLTEPDGPSAFASSPLYSMSASIPGAYASLPATGLLAAPPATPITDVSTGGGFKQYILSQGADNKTGKFGGTYYKIEPRCPINVNTASREVLVAQMMDLEASFWDYTVVSESAAKKEYDSRLGLITSKLTKAEAEAAADFLIGGRFTHGTPAGSWSYNDWMHFEDEVINKIPGLTRFQLGLLKANGNSNRTTSSVSTSPTSRFPPRSGRSAPTGSLRSSRSAGSTTGRRSSPRRRSRRS